MNPYLRAPRLRWPAPSFLTLVGLFCFCGTGWILFEAIEEEQALEALFQPDAKSIELAQAAERWAERGVEGLPRLKEALASPNPLTREYGLLALIYMPTEDAVLVRSEVRRLCDDPVPSVQSNALILMAKLTDEPEKFASVAASRMMSSDSELVDGGKTAVRQIGLPAVPAVAEVLPHVGRFTQSSCLNFLSRYVFNEQHGSLATQAVAGALEAEDPEVREQAYRLLSSIRPLTAKEIGVGLKDPHRKIQRMVLSEAVGGESPDPENLNRLQVLLKTQPDLRVSVLKAIAVYGSQAADTFGEIQQWTQDSDPQVRLEAATTLVRIANSSDRAVPYLENLLVDSHPEVARRAAQLLAEVTPESIPSVISEVLLPRLSSPNVPTQVSAAAALSGVPEAAAKERLTLIRLLAEQSAEFAVAPAVRFQLTEALGNMGPNARDAIPVLLGLVQQADGNDPQLIVPLKALGKIGGSDPVVRQTLLQLYDRMSHRSRTLRMVVLETLGKLGHGDADVFRLLAARARNAGSARERLTALRGMVACRMNSQATQATLTLALSDEDSNIRIGACLLLMERKNVQDLAPSLAVLLEDDCHFVRLLATHSLAKLGPKARSAELALIHVLDNPDYQGSYYYYSDDEEVQWNLFDEDLRSLRRSSLHHTAQLALTAMYPSPHNVQTAQSGTL